MNNWENSGVGEIQPLTPFNIGLYIFSFLTPIFFLKPWDLNMAQGIFFVFGVFTLLGLSFYSKRYTNYINKELGFFILWSMFCLFIHTFTYSLTNTYASNFINFCLMSEGFIYILCGFVLFYLVVSFTNNSFNIAYPILLVSVLNLIFALLQYFHIYPFGFGIEQIADESGVKHVIQQNICGLMGTKSQLSVFSAIVFPILYSYWAPLSIVSLVCIFLSHSYTGFVALIIGLLIYSTYQIKKQRIMQGFIVLLILIAIPFVKWGKADIRFHIFPKVLKEIVSSPIFGHGFDNSLNMNKIEVNSGNYHQFVYRHNDYLNIARDLGLPFLIVLLMEFKYIMSGFPKHKITLLWASVLIGLIACGFQTSFYFARIAGIGIVLLALLERERCRINVFQQ